jgi:hypothetical protein
MNRIVLIGGYADGEEMPDHGADMVPRPGQHAWHYYRREQCGCRDAAGRRVFLWHRTIARSPCEETNQKQGK